ncbi:hypothetical protein E1281_00665 [Actinomadura sp. KC345]|uniref:VOC family protein n=1 Tax=Actinomadura sp. KC345 TaxID=2530371 RepID=UPI0010461A4E|nr:VOC family protein [Actinomadura sp. KC345]TDC58653.1 hypothetical protein E1281_00665 [Actinomadura sp. KC345]
MISELRVATVAVSDLERSVAFYRDVFGYVAGPEVAVGGPEIERAWRMPAGLTGRTVVLGPEGATTGLVRLVSFDAPGDRIWGDYSRAQDYGHYALNIRVDDVRATVHRLREAGGRAKSEPTRWTVTPELAAWDSLSYDPDGVILDVFELEARDGSPLAEYDGSPSELQTVAVHVGDARAAMGFYGALGFEPMYDQVIEGMEAFFRLPPGTSLHNINMYMPGGTMNGRVEIAQYVGFPGRDQRDRAVPPNTGLLSVSLETDDLPATAGLLAAHGAVPVCDPVELDVPPYGPAAVQTFLGRDGELLEFYRRR